MHAVRGRHQGRQGMSWSTLVMISILASTFFYVYFSNMGGMYDEIPLAEERCIFELGNVKYQLRSISDYKKKMDGLLNELQRDVKSQKKALKELGHNYIFVRKHLEMCEAQTEELEFKCAELKAKLQKVYQELQMCKKPVG